jgi:hypothetical protein
MTFKYNPDTPLSVLVPKNFKDSFIDSGSAIVTIPFEDVNKIYFEGNRFQAENLFSIEGRLQVAASRLLCSYPTVAFQVLNTGNKNELYEEVGTYIYSSNTLDILSEQKNKWDEWVNLYDPNKSA